MAQFKNLFRPIKIGEVELKNRIVMLAVTTGYVEAGNMVSDRLITFFSERAKGGAGFIIVPFTPVDIASPMEPGLYHDRFLPGARSLVDAVHAHGAKIAAQLLAQYHWVISEGCPAELVAPSPVLNRVVGATPRVLSVEEIHQLVEEYGEAGRRARKAGFDAIELPLGGGYLLSRFLSSCTNKRSDEYGGSLQNRMRLPLEVIENIRKKVGEDYTIICRLSVEEFMEGGHTIEDSRKVASTLESAGIHALNVQAGWHECPVPLVQMSVPRGAFVYLAEEIKKVTRIPVVAAHRITDPILAEHILSQGKADLVGMARALIADPELPNKAKEGRVDEIRPCIACSRCLDEILPVYKYKNWGEPVSIFCTVNPRAGKEMEYVIKPAAKAKRVFVVGGGPGGMEAARVAALRGHKVTLYEKQDRLGGKLLVSCLPPYKDEVGYLTKNLTIQVHNAGVMVKLNTEISAELIAQEKPDAVVLASGATEIIPGIPGVRGDSVVTAIQVLTESVEIGEEVIIIGGGMVGCETAEFLARRGKKVTIVEMLPRIGNDLGVTSRPFVMKRLRELAIRMETGVSVEEITDKGVRGNRDGASEFFAGDTVVLATGFKSNKAVAEELEGKVTSLYLIGDCVEPRMIKEAIGEGFRVGMEI
jgi:2,4-dienoyl-CoA reductase (NADPH2)